MDKLEYVCIGWDVARWNTEKNAFIVCWKENGQYMMQEIKPSLFPQGKILQDIHSETHEDFIAFALKEFFGDAYDENSTRVILAIDAPLGYPCEFSEYFMGIRSHQLPKNISYERMAFRETEQVIFDETGKMPPSITLDNAGNRASVAMVVTQMLRAMGYAILPLDTQMKLKNIIEVYPRILKYRRFKVLNTKYSSLIKAPINCRMAQEYYRTSSFPKPDTKELDVYDAALSALFGMEFMANGCNLNIPADKEEMARKEGWIYIPSENSLL